MRHLEAAKDAQLLDVRAQAPGKRKRRFTERFEIFQNVIVISFATTSKKMAGSDKTSFEIGEVFLNWPNVCFLVSQQAVQFRVSWERWLLGLGGSFSFSPRKTNFFPFRKYDNLRMFWPRRFVLGVSFSAFLTVKP